MNLGVAARQLRESFGLSQRAAADRLGVSYVHMCNIENDKSRPSPELLQKYRQVFGVDLYVYCWSSQPNLDKVPPSMRDVSRNLAQVWEKLIEQRRKSFREGA